MGVNFHTTGKFHKTARDVITKTKQKIDAMWPTLMRAKLPKFNNFLQYFDSVILPKITYAAPAWALDQADIIELAQTHLEGNCY